MEQVDNFDCKSCGACCCFKWSWPVLRRDRLDAVNIPKEMVRTDFPLMKTIDNRCIALDGKVGKSVCCKVYDDRPNSCRQFEPGSDLCREARKKVLEQN
jgi:Fe-S-cluster containining protein